MSKPWFLKVAKAAVDKLLASCSSHLLLSSCSLPMIPKPWVHFFVLLRLGSFVFSIRSRLRKNYLFFGFEIVYTDFTSTIWQAVF